MTPRRLPRPLPDDVLGDDALAEGYVPGGLAWDEHAAVPTLADYECRDCGALDCDDGCEP